MGLIQRFREWLNPPPPAAPPPPPTFYASPELIGEIRRLKEQADWMERLIEEDERSFTYGEDGTVQFGMSQGDPSTTMFSYSWAYSQGMFRPSYGACFFINEAQHRIIRARSRAFASVNPYWHGVQHTLKTHVVGMGHNWTVVPRDPDEKVSPAKAAKAQRELDDFYWGTGEYEGFNGAPYRTTQGEKVDRKSRDGEFILHCTVEDAKLRVRFWEPLLLWTPATATYDSTNEVLFGIQFKRGDYEKPLRYHLRTTDYLGATNDDDPLWHRGIEADKIQHRKVNVDRGCPRGIPDTYWVQSRLEQSLRTLRAMGTLVQVRAKIAMIRKRVNALAGAVQPQLSASAAATITNSAGQVRNVFSYPEGAILDTSDQAEYQFPGQNIETDKIVASVQADLQAVATSMGLADYMVSGNLGSGSYATAMVASGPVVKTFQQQQTDMIEEDRRIATRVLQTAIDAKRLDEDTLELLTIEMHGPSLAASDGVQDAQARQIEHQQGVLSKTTWRQVRGYDPGREETNFKSEAEEELKVQTIQGIAPGQNQGGDGEQGGGQPRNRQAATARPFSPDEEPRQKQRASGATREEENRMLESSHDPQSQERLTQEDLAMAAQIIPEGWLPQIKAEILALARFAGPPNENAAPTDYEPGIKGIYLGTVDGQEVWAIDMRAMMVKYNCPDLVVAGNSTRWTFLPRNKIIVDWSFTAADRACDILHELIEQLLGEAGWSYARSHRYANQGPGCESAWLLELRPELAALKPPIKD